MTGISAFDLDTAPPARHDRDGDIRGDFLEPKLTTNGDVFNSDGAHISSVMSGSPGYDKCQAAASGGGDQTDKLSVGEVLCVQTDGGHVARLKVTTAHQTASDPVLKLDVTVWNAPGG